ncbi:SSNA1 protein, partial [Chordeiles acutipennis]|nr:SSNA1 protein [Chordeiles acutipennis]
GLAELRARREELNGRIRLEEEEQKQLQGRLWLLTEKLARTNESLARNMVARGELDRTIAETEAAYGKILENSQTLLDVLKGEIGNAGKAKEPQSTSKGKEEKKHR